MLRRHRPQCPSKSTDIFFPLNLFFIHAKSSSRRRPREAANTTNEKDPASMKMKIARWKRRPQKRRVRRRGMRGIHKGNFSVSDRGMRRRSHAAWKTRMDQLRKGLRGARKSKKWMEIRA